MKRDELPRLIEEIQKGDNEAFAQLYHEFYTAFFYMALKLTNNEADAHDAVQDTFIKIQKHIKDLKNPNVAIVWMKKILFNRCKNMFRGNRDIYMDENALTAMEPEEKRSDVLPNEQMRRQSERDVMMRLLANVPYLYREPLILKYYDDAKMSEIAKVLGIPEGTVKSRLRTGKKLLKEQIALYEEESKERVPYHVFPLGWSLFFCFQKEARQFAHEPLKYKNYLPKSAYRLIACAGLGICAAVGGGVWTHEIRKNAVNPIIDYPHEGISDQEAYFYLKGKAHCEADLRSINQEELVSLMPYVEQLKVKKGPFYSLLVQDGWLAVFESLIDQ